MRPLTADQLLIIVDEFCTRHPVRVRSFAALAAAAAVPAARLRGVRVFDSVSDAKKALMQTIVRLSPLTGENELFARVAGSVYERYAHSDI